MPAPFASTLLLPGFPVSVGANIMSILDHKGPASYTQLGVATPPTGGDVLTAAECGMKYIDAVSSQLSDDGQYSVDATETIGGASEVVLVRLIWMIAHTGAEAAGAANLSARTVRIIVWGR